MTRKILLSTCLFAALAGIAASAGAVVVEKPRTAGTGQAVALPPYLQCVPYARQLTGINIYGDAHTWWGQAEGRYARGYKPRVGAVLALRPHGGSRLGHVAAVSKIVDSRTLLIRHSNWSPINGRRGQIEDNVKVVDVSPANDWSVVRVWYAPLNDLGGTHWPVQGFIYPAKPKKDENLKDRPVPANLPRGSDDPIADLIGERMGW